MCFFLCLSTNDRFSILVIGTGTGSFFVVGLVVMIVAVVEFASPFFTIFFLWSILLLSLGEGVRTTCALPPLCVVVVDEVLEFVRDLLLLPLTWCDVVDDGDADDATYDNS